MAPPPPDPRHREALRERLAELREKLRTAIAARKERIKELRALARKERLELRDQLRAMRVQALSDLHAKMGEARRAAKLARLARREQAKAMADSQIAEARAAIRIELQHLEEMRHVDAEERRQRGAIEADHAKRVSDGAVRAAVLGHFGPLFERFASTVAPAPGESKTEAVLRHVERRPDVAHAVLEPSKEQAIATTRAAIASTEEALRRLPKGAPANRTKPRAASRPSPTTTARPANSTLPPAAAPFADALARWVAGEQRTLNETGQRRAPGTKPFLLTTEPGGRYVRIVQAERGGDGSRSVYAFVDSTNGDVLNPASWKAPKPPSMGTRRRGSIYGPSAPAATSATKKKPRSAARPSPPQGARPS